MKELLCVMCKHKDLGDCSKQCLRKMVLSIKVSLSLNHLKTREIGGFERKSPSCINNKSESKTSGQAKSDDPKYKSSVAAETEKPQDASLNIESANQNQSIQREEEEKSELMTEAIGE